MSFQKILCAVDFSPSARAALELAAKMAIRSGGSLTLLHVYEIPASIAFPEVSLDAGFLQPIVEEAQRELAAWRAEAEKLGVAKVDTLNVRGTPWSEVVDQAKAGSYDVIVIGTHGRTGLKHVLLGSVAERVVRHASCAVLVARASGGAS
jgi:nucleotide-binding universal stress UspA family protein